MNSNIVDVTAQNAQQILIDESRKRPVVIDFWAEWCEPCKSLMPVLEKLANEYAGKFLLARVNADELQPIAQQLGVRSLPTVMIMIDGQPVDGFSGALPEIEVRAVLDKHLPAAWQGLIEQANVLMGQDNFAAALELLLQAYRESGEDSAVGIGVAQVYLHLNRCDDAEAMLQKVPMVDQDAFYQQTLAQLELKREAATSPEMKALEQQYATNPDDLAVAHALAVQYSQNGKPRDALELLLKVLRKDLNFDEGAAKKAYMDILASLGKDPLAVEFQRKIYTLLY
ncbi:co-chaperone YbbN [Pseudomaricurvus sp. HS19]|uniref:thioredoxin family protein n=1 Tax=Pseudomaricurvus sp. HS19 TaxID=2692626 RepID=UPI0013706547|nr:co-chaperone YbbN [Pseudomaricurvus sp. HS19]MYM62168.1 tetratricopeptide repeat protein [Pseudomaricurvus sp. HS19]